MELRLLSGLREPTSELWVGRSASRRRSGSLHAFRTGIRDHTRVLSHERHPARSRIETGSKHGGLLPRDLAHVPRLLSTAHRTTTNDVRRLPDAEPGQVVAVHAPPGRRKEIVGPLQPHLERTERGVAGEPLALLDELSGAHDELLTSHRAPRGLVAGTVHDAGAAAGGSPTSARDTSSIQRSRASRMPRLHGPGRPVPIDRPPRATSGTTPATLLVRKASSAAVSSSGWRRRSTTSMPRSAAWSSSHVRVVPARIAASVGGGTSRPSMTAKTFAEVLSLTAPSSVRKSASSTAARSASSFACT